MKAAVLVVLLAAAAVSLFYGIRNAFHLSNDLQWSGVVLLHQHLDPFQVYLDGDPAHQLKQWQIPNYLHEMYILELPLGSLSFADASRVWAFINLGFTALSVFLLIRFYRLPHYYAALFACAVLCSTGFRNSLGNGQQSLFALAAFVVTMCLSSQWKRTVGLSGLYAKYSFAPVVLGYTLARGEFQIFASSLLLPLLGYVAFLYLIHWSHPLRLLIEPLLVSRTGITPGKADLMTLLEQQHLFPTGSIVATALPYALGLSLALLYGWFVVRSRLSREAAVAGVAAATLVCVKHVEYDLVLLIVPLAYFAGKRTIASIAPLAILSYLLYLDRWTHLDQRLPPQPARLVYFLLIAAVLFLIHKTDRRESSQLAE